MKSSSREGIREAISKQNSDIPPSVTTPISKEEHIAQMAVQKEKVEKEKPIIAGLLHEVRIAKADSDLSMREWAKKLGHTEEGKERFAKLDWLQATFLVEANPSKTSEIKAKLIQQRDESKKKAAEIGELASFCYQRRILFDPNESRLSGEEAAKKAEDDWRQARELVDNGDREAIETIRQSVAQLQEKMPKDDSL